MPAGCSKCQKGAKDTTPKRTSKEVVRIVNNKKPKK